MPIGYEVQRAVAPLKTLRAEAAVLITTSRTGKPGVYHDRVRAAVKDLGIPCCTIDCNFWDPAVVVDTVGGIIAALPQHDYYFNASTGSKTCAIGGQTAAMFYPIRPYYQSVNHDASVDNHEDDHPTVGEPRMLHAFKVAPLDKDALVLLEYLAAHPEGVAKFEVLAHLKTKGIIGPKKGQAEVTAPALHAQVDVLRRRLEAWDFLTEDAGRGAGLRLSLNQKGMAGHTMFQHRLRPRAPPSELAAL